MVEMVVGVVTSSRRRLRWMICAGVGAASLLTLGAVGAHAENPAHLKQVKASQTRTHDIVDLRFDRAPHMWAPISDVPNPKYVERVTMGASGLPLKLPGKAVLSVALDYANTYNFNGPQVPDARQRLTRRIGNILRAQTADTQHNRLEFAVAVAAPRHWKVVMQPHAKRVRIMIARRGPLAPVACDQYTTPPEPVGRWNTAYRITSATGMRCAQVARTIRNANMINPSMINAGERFSIGKFTCKAGSANAEGVATGHCRLGKRAFTVQATEIAS